MRTTGNLKAIRLRKTFNGCIECVSHYRNKHGYTQIKHEYKPIFLHRFIYTYLFGEILNNLILRHKCDNPACCNPQHLELGTYKNNSEDRDTRGRGAIGEKQGLSKLTEKQVREIKHLKGTGITSTDLAKKYNVDQSTICRVWSNATWKHIT